MGLLTWIGIQNRSPDCSQALAFLRNKVDLAFKPNKWCNVSKGKLSFEGMIDETSFSSWFGVNCRRRLCVKSVGLVTRCLRSNAADDARKSNLLSQNRCLALSK